jgi:F-type H+-transporting ATPase subunit a
MASPVEQFKIVELFPIEIGGINASFTNSSFLMLCVAAGMSALLYLGTRSVNMVPGRVQAAVESLYDLVADICEQNIGHGDAKKFFPFILALFLFVLGCNFAGMIPFSFTVTSHIAVTFAFAAFVFLVCIGFGVARHGLHYFSKFVPPGVPMVLLPLIVLIEIVAFLARPITLSVRLFANMTAGHILLKVFAGFVVSLGLAGGWAAISWVPMVGIVAFTALEILIAGLQAFIFAVLTAIYLGDSLHIEH